MLGTVLSGANAMCERGGLELLELETILLCREI